MQQWNYQIIGTHINISIDTSIDCGDLFIQIRNRLNNFESIFSRFIEGNWLYNLNTSRHAIMDLDAKNMLVYTLSIADKTDGYFDPTISKRLTELGYGLALKYEGTTSTYGDYRDIEIQGDHVHLNGDILLEFGGVGKGYLIDLIKEMIDNKFPRIDMHQSIPGGFSELRYLINFGGDMYGRGNWKVGLESPFALDEVIGTLVLDSNFLACSAGTRRKWGRHHHLLDPKTGESAHEVIASYIEGDSGIMVDSHATALCVMPWEYAVNILEITPEISGVIIRHDGVPFKKEGSRCELFN